MFMMISRDVVPAFARQATALEAPLGMERRQLNLETCARDGQPDTSAVHITVPDPCHSCHILPSKLKGGQCCNWMWFNQPSSQEICTWQSYSGVAPSHMIHEACGSSRFRFIQVQVQKVAHLRQRWDEFKLGDVDRTSEILTSPRREAPETHMAGYLYSTLWWTNIAIENGHRNSGFSH